MHPEIDRLLNATDGVQESKQALLHLALQMPVKVGHVADSEDFERQRYEALEIDDYMEHMVEHIDHGFRYVREQGFDVAFNKTARNVHVRKNKLKTTQERLEKPIVARYIGASAIRGEQLSMLRYGRTLIANVTLDHEQYVQHTELKLIDQDGVVLLPTLQLMPRISAHSFSPSLKKKAVLNPS